MNIERQRSPYVRPDESGGRKPSMTSLFPSVLPTTTTDTPGVRSVIA